MEPVLCLRRILLQESRSIIHKLETNDNICDEAVSIINRFMGKSFIKSIELARNADLIQPAQAFILNAENYAPEELFVEKAKLFWQTGDQRNGLTALERGIKHILDQCDNNPKKVPEKQQQIFGEAKFLIATYNAESMNTNKELIIKLFDEASQAMPESEKCFVNYAQYLERVLIAIQNEQLTNTDSALNQRENECQLKIMKFYGNSMNYGCRYIHQSMPRVLSIWLDFPANDSHGRRIMRDMNSLATRFGERLPSFIFFTKFSQLVSRICHPLPDVFNVIKQIIVKLILDFPQQSLWMLLSVYNSSYSNRVERCTIIFNDKKLKDPAIQKIINDFKQFATLLIKLTEKDLPDSSTTYTLTDVCPRLMKLFKSKELMTAILLPIERMMQPILPAIADRDSSARLFNAFPHNAIYIESIKNDIIVLTSLQKPKRITMIASDGNEYHIMLKANDDLRIDFRLMEFNAVVKQYLRQDPVARHHRLYIRTYAVTPLTESCGLLEWVDNLTAYRNILDSK